MSERQTKSCRSFLKPLDVPSRSRVPDERSTGHSRRRDVDFQQPAIGRETQTRRRCAEDGADDGQPRHAGEYVITSRVIGYRDEHRAVEGGGKSTETTDRHDLIRRNTYLMCFAHGLGRERVRAAERDPRMLQRHFDL